MRSLLLLVVIIPTLGMIAIAGSAAGTASAKRNASERVRDKAETLNAIIDARLAVAGEEAESSTLAIASDLGVGARQLQELYGINYVARLRAARKVLDADPILGAVPELRAARARLRPLRAAVDAGTATFNEVRPVFDDLTAGLDEVWRVRFSSLRSELRSNDLAGALHDRVDAVPPAFEAMSWGSRRAGLAVRLLRAGPDPVTLTGLLDAASRQRSATESFAALLGPEAASVAAQHRADPVVQRFERTLDDVAKTFLAGVPSPLASDPAAFGDAFADGAAWVTGLTSTLRAAARDLRIEAARQERAAGDALRNEVVVAVLLTVIALVGALLLARSVTRPIRRLESGAHQIRDGRFDLDPIDTTGPRELSDTAVSFNEMAKTLAGVESHAVALADDPDASILDHQLPGRTGRALQVALNQLRTSIRKAERQRRDLEQAATHDGLTGLLNRGAALAMIERDLSQASRSGAMVMALFVDVDGLKPINDEHGHAAGDDALRLTANALRASTRQSDVVARIGGDEFLVAGIVDSRVEVELLAERIRQAVATRTLAGATAPIPLRCSIGMALSGPSTATVDALIHRADAGLYVAKRRGRDQACWDDQTDFGDVTAGVGPTRQA